MTKRTRSAKLSLNRETLRQLQDRELARAAGGRMYDPYPTQMSWCELKCLTNNKSCTNETLSCP